jgi:hypothetical protein
MKKLIEIVYDLLNFAELLVETAVNSLHDSCRSELSTIF